MKDSHILTSDQFTRSDLDRLFQVADEMMPFAQKKAMSDIMEGKILATLFFEPSTRTRFSFETAMLRLGGQVISNHIMTETSSVTKGETLFDTGKTVSIFADVIVVRHPEYGSVAELAKGSSVPVINAGDGTHDHPTQGLLDVYTIQKEVRDMDALTIAMVGDLKNSRVVHSQCRLLKNYRDVNFMFISPDGLRMPAEIVADLKGAGFNVIETDDFEAVLPKVDVLSMTRVQKERFSSEKEYEKFKGVYVLTPEMLSKMRKDAIVLAPLPRVDEICVSCDKDPRVKYFDQIQNGVALRMALFAVVSGVK